MSHPSRASDARRASAAGHSTASPEQPSKRSKTSGRAIGGEAMQAFLTTLEQLARLASPAASIGAADTSPPMPRRRHPASPVIQVGRSIICVRHEYLLISA